MRAAKSDHADRASCEKYVIIQRQTDRQRHIVTGASSQLLICLSATDIINHMSAAAFDIVSIGMVTPEK